MGKETGRSGFVGRVGEVPDEDDGRGRRIASRGRGNKKVRRPKLIDAGPHPSIEVIDRNGFAASSAKLFESPEGTLELPLSCGSGAGAFPIIGSGNRKLFEFGEEASSTNFGPRRLLIRRETGDEILRGI
jgi:hypothetical protein